MEFAGIARADRDEAACRERAAAGGEICSLVQDVLELSRLLRVLNLPEFLPLVGVRDVFRLPRLTSGLFPGRWGRCPLTIA
ncbi:hypothetical protein [Nocardioides zeae]|uniref:Uncharacterized protein n=1 Tax=Nocardioides zeae TaxID=1457234 RepID=A0A6P0HF52_9ACTN|nr:hypothetical protein [Nocardioides zeae]NEN77166.1 hypothetical protein [Nocardioides zeae]